MLDQITDEPSLTAQWRERLAEAEHAYRQHHTLENRAEWRRVLKIFRDLVYGKEPPPGS